MHWASESILRVAWTQSWQVAVLAALVAIAARLACRRRPHLAYLLWMLVIIKALTPPLWSSPTGAFSWATMQTTRPVAAKRLEPAPFPTEVVASVPLEQAIAPNAQVAKGSSVVGPPEPVGLMLAFAEVRVSVWMIGTFGLLSILLARWFKLVRVLRRTTQEIDPALEQQFGALHRQIGPGRPVRLVCTSAPLGPAAFGFWRGTVIVPLSLVRDKTADELAPILAHELIHLRRFDTLAANVQLLAQVLWWFHPAVWWANRQARIERERACDEEVVAELDCRPADYARLLVEILQWRQHLSPAVSWPGMRSWDVTSSRIAHVLDHAHRFRRRASLACWLVVACAVAVALPGAGLQRSVAAGDGDLARDEQPEPEPEPPKNAAPPAAPNHPDHAAKATAAIAELKRLGLEVRHTGSGSWLGRERVMQMVTDVALPSSFQPGPAPLPLADIPNLWISIGAPSTGGMGAIATPTTPPAEARLREQILAVSQLHQDGRLLVTVDASNAAALDALESIPGLRKLTISARAPLPQALRFNRLTNLRELSWSAPVDDLGRLAPLKNLERLVVSGPTTDAALEPLTALSNLKSLMLQNYNVNQSLRTLDLDCLEGLPNLEELTLFSYSLSDRAARRIESHPRIRYVWADFGAMTDAGLGEFAAAKQLQTLNLTTMRGAQGLTSGGLAALGSLTNLETLRIDGRPWSGGSPLVVTDQSIAGSPPSPGWQALGKLQWLRIEPCRIRDAGLRALGQLKSLVDLQLVGELNITDQGLAALAGLSQLRTLVLPKSTINGSGISALAGLDRLEKLSLRDTPIDDAGLKQIAQLESLRQLDLSGSAVTDQGLQLLRDKLPNLERLNLARTQTSDQGFEALLSQKNLRQFDASETRLTAALMARMLKENPQLSIWVTESDNSQSVGGGFIGRFQPIDLEN